MQTCIQTTCIFCFDVKIKIDPRVMLQGSKNIRNFCINYVPGHDGTSRTRIAIHTLYYQWISPNHGIPI